MYMVALGCFVMPRLEYYEEQETSNTYIFVLANGK